MFSTYILYFLLVCMCGWVVLVVGYCSYNRQATSWVESKASPARLSVVPCGFFVVFGPSEPPDSTCFLVLLFCTKRRLMKHETLSVWLLESWVTSLPFHLGSRAWCDRDERARYVQIFRIQFQCGLFCVVLPLILCFVLRRMCKVIWVTRQFSHVSSQYRRC